MAVVYPLPENSVFNAVCDAEQDRDFVEIKLWDEQRLEFLRRFLPFERGIPRMELRGALVTIDAIETQSAIARRPWRWAAIICRPSRRTAPPPMRMSPDRDADRERDQRIGGVERPALPFGDCFQHCVGDGRHQVGQ